MTTTLAAVLHGARDLRVEEVPIGAPGAGEVLLEVAYGGICGSDLHYLHHGRGTFSVVREPLVLGHEVSAVVVEAGHGVDGLPAGAAVALAPAVTCGRCPACLDGRRQSCAAIRYLGAASTPPVQGAFARRFVAQAGAVHPLPEGVDLRVGALAEPLAVAVHAVRRAGNVAGSRVLVTGAGPIGLLTAVAARAAGAASVTVTDLQASALALALRIGVDEVFDVSDTASAAALAERAATFDVAIEASGAAAALVTAADALRSGGRIVQLGMPPMNEFPVPMSTMMSRELDYRMTLRYGSEFPEAVRLLARFPELDALITSVVPLSEAWRAFELAADRTASSKVLLDLTA